MELLYRLDQSQGKANAALQLHAVSCARVRAQEVGGTGGFIEVRPPWLLLDSMLLQIRHDEIKGRGLFAARPISAGEVVLQELPFMLYPQQSAADSVCSHCLRALHTPGEHGAARAAAGGGRCSGADRRELLAPTGAGTDVMVCSSCSSAAFCSPECAEAVATDAGSHCAQVCQWLTACNMQGLTDDQQSALQFLFRCVSLLQAAAAGDARSTQRRGQLQQLAPGPARVPVAVTTELQELHGRLAHALAAAGTPQLAAGLSVQEVAEMLERDETNGYGILAPAQGPHGERRIRGTGLYAQASPICGTRSPRAAGCALPVANSHSDALCAGLADQPRLPAQPGAL